MFQEVLKSPPKPELWAKLSAENRKYSQYLSELGDRITILTQGEQKGFGHAVHCARDWVGNEPFLLLLGDHVYTSETESSCAAQMVNSYQQNDTSVIGITVMHEDVIQKAGCIAGTWQSDRNLAISQIYEKPTLEYAREHLRVADMAENEFLGVFGMYVLEPVIFELLESEITNNERFKGEFQLTTCLDKLRAQQGAIGYLVRGQYYDTGMPLFYRQTAIDYYNNQP